MAAESTLEIRRKSAYIDRLRKYAVLVDGDEVGKIKNGETMSFSIAPGAHEVKTKVDWVYSPPITIDAPTGGTVVLMASAKANPFTALYYTLFAKNKYLKLEPAP